MNENQAHGGGLGPAVGGEVHSPAEGEAITDSVYYHSQITAYSILPVTQSVLHMVWDYY